MNSFRQKQDSYLMTKITIKLIGAVKMVQRPQKSKRLQKAKIVKKKSKEHRVQRLVHLTS